MILLSKKRSGKIKDRGCADGRKQRFYLSKEDTSSPPVATESLMLSYEIDTCEGRGVGNIDIPCAFMQANMEGDIVDMKLEGTMADIFTKLE